MVRLHYSVDIVAPRRRVWDVDVEQPDPQVADLRHGLDHLARDEVESTRFGGESELAADPHAVHVIGRRGLWRESAIGPILASRRARRSRQALPNRSALCNTRPTGGAWSRPSASA